MSTELVHEILPIAHLRLDGGTQPRAEMSQETIDAYAEDMQRGDIFPALDVFYDGADFWLADGFHRLQAALAVRREQLLCAVHQGSQRDAVLFSLRVNRDHGLRRSNADKRQSVRRMLDDPEWNQWSNRAIAEHTGVSDMFVGKLREEMTANGLQSPAVRVGRDGRTYDTTHLQNRERNFLDQWLREKEAHPDKTIFLIPGGSPNRPSTIWVALGSDAVRVARVLGVPLQHLTIPSRPGRRWEVVKLHVQSTYAPWFVRLEEALGGRWGSRRETDEEFFKLSLGLPLVKPGEHEGQAIPEAPSVEEPNPETGEDADTPADDYAWLERWQEFKKRSPEMVHFAQVGKNGHVWICFEGDAARVARILHVPMAKFKMPGDPFPLREAVKLFVADPKPLWFEGLYQALDGNLLAYPEWDPQLKQISDQQLPTAQVGEAMKPAATSQPESIETASSEPEPEDKLEACPDCGGALKQRTRTDQLIRPSDGSQAYWLNTYSLLCVDCGKAADRIERREIEGTLAPLPTVKVLQDSDITEEYLEQLREMEGNAPDLEPEDAWILALESPEIYLTELVGFCEKALEGEADPLRQAILGCAKRRLEVLGETLIQTMNKLMGFEATLESLRARIAQAGSLEELRPINQEIQTSRTGWPALDQYMDELRALSGARLKELTGMAPAPRDEEAAR